MKVALTFLFFLSPWTLAEPVDCSIKAMEDHPAEAAIIKAASDPAQAAESAKLPPEAQAKQREDAVAAQKTIQESVKKCLADLEKVPEKKAPESHSADECEKIAERSNKIDYEFYKRLKYKKKLSKPEQGRMNQIQRRMAAAKKRCLETATD
ncbi:MAG: hypothetical protein AB7F86_09430 [Bdellovibrionales bacterium]